MFKTWKKDKFAFGGENLGRAHARSKRIFRRKLAIHVVLHSSIATGSKSLLKHARRIEEVLFKVAKKQHVTVYSAANSGNHLHLLVQAPSSGHLSNFLRAVSGRIAMLATGSRKHHPQSQKFWDFRPFSRLVSFGKDFKTVLNYIALNSTESSGFSRNAACQMFKEIRDHIKREDIPRSANLSAAGFI